MNTPRELDKGYDPGGVEERWYAYWEEEKLFAADKAGSENPAYSIVIPPPNVTGMLHMGHALNITLQDILCRYRRLCGDNVLWMPGTDHAGIATQNVVEKKLLSEGTSRHDLGREAFIEKVWEWRREYGGTIIRQLKRLGASCDWDRERFTMDDGLSMAVRTVFKTLYDEGLIYRGKYLINWCPRCHTAIADIEVEYEEMQGGLYYIRYPFVDGDGGLVVATTRPETMLGDTAVAVNPDDERYAAMAGRTVHLPLTDRVIPVIADKYVDTSFGTGALKITPAHDPNDFEIGRIHGLDMVKVIDDKGFMTAEAGERFAGLERSECRKAVVAALDKEGLLENQEAYTHSVGTCYRCHTVVEPNLSKQWFVNVKPLAEKAVQVVQDGQTRIIPDNWEKTYYEWMDNIRDWCVSRQIWWGHRIPAWYCDDCGEVMVEITAPGKCASCESTALTRESDVLDTWFSSALWPFSTMGWPEETRLLKTFYPTSVLVTGFDILFFWVARMLMMGVHFMKAVPFADVYIHALVRDEDGKKMSKSTGNVIDPIEVIENYGADALRFTLAAFAAQGRDVKLSESRIEGYRHFINKLWNAARFALMHIDDSNCDETLSDASLADRWILSRLSTLRQTVAEAIDTYKFNEAAVALYQFVWHEFCDWYLEAVKPDLYGKKGDSRREGSKTVLRRVLSDVLVMLHPIVPFVTEEIWHALPGDRTSIMQAAFPTAGPAMVAYDADAEAEMELVMGVITGIRNVRGEMNISPSKTLSAEVHAGDDQTLNRIAANEDMIVNLARLDSLTVTTAGEKPKFAATSVVGNATVYALLEGVIDFEKEKTRIEKEMTKLEKDLAGVSGKLNNEAFLNKAPADVVAKVRASHEHLLAHREKLQATLEKVAEMA
ncbi:MAG: valine--tRNA ligase [Thermodesulfobacteriota bacterium]|nr:valine--tRNA ligase [Thermodesulfobacteriota bacterium]